MMLYFIFIVIIFITISPTLLQLTDLLLMINKKILN